MDRSLGIVAGCGARDTLVDDNDTALSLHSIAADNVCSRGGQGASASPPYSPLDLCGRSVSAVHAAAGPRAGSPRSDLRALLRRARPGGWRVRNHMDPPHGPTGPSSQPDSRLRTERRWQETIG